jgi:hypothetical protein
VLGRAVEPGQSHRLTPGTPIWVWVVRLARGRWWPGTVEALRTIDGRLLVAVKVECRRVRDGDATPVTVGITTTAMRYVELRNIHAKGFDQPRRPPVSLLQRPEQHEPRGPRVTDPPRGVPLATKAGAQVPREANGSGRLNRD